MSSAARRLTAGLIAASALAFAAAPVGRARSESKTVAMVNGDAVSEGELIRIYKQLPQQVRARGLEAVYPLLLEDVIGRKLITAKARQQGLADSPEFRAQLTDAENDLLFQFYVTREAESRIDAAAVRKAYDEWAARQAAGEEVQTSHILVKTEEEAKQIIQLVTDGTPFAELAKERSIDSGSAAKGGDLGYIRRGDTVKPFEDAAFGLQANTFTAEPVKSKFGWHVILVSDRRKIAPPAFEEVAPQFRQRLVESKAREVIKESIAAATVERFDLNGNPLSPPAAR